jgi:hypothetical protein
MRRKHEGMKPQGGRESHLATLEEFTTTPSSLEAGPSLRGHVLVDGHVHFHRCFNEKAFFDQAWTNFQASAAAAGLGEVAAGFLLLTECAADSYFRQLRRRERIKCSSWTLRQTAEAISLLASRPGGERMFVVAGRQIATREGLEVLALGPAASFRDGLDLASTVAAVRAANALPVLPWGFGKWSGRRAELLERFLQANRTGPIFLGDNGGRSATLGTPPQLERAAGHGLIVLPGSDPLPLRGEVGRVGGYGFVLEAEIEPEYPAAGLMQHLLSLDHQPPTFGELKPFWRFCVDQLALRIPGNWLR